MKNREINTQCGANTEIYDVFLRLGIETEEKRQEVLGPDYRKKKPEVTLVTKLTHSAPKY